MCVSDLNVTRMHYDTGLWPKSIDTYKSYKIFKKGLVSQSVRDTIYCGMYTGNDITTPWKKFNVDIETFCTNCIHEENGKKGNLLPWMYGWLLQYVECWRLQDNNWGFFHNAVQGSLSQTTRIVCVH